MNDRQRRFCEAYAVDPNATRAAIAAGYSERTARAAGQRLLTKVDIVTYLSELTEKTFSQNIAGILEVRSFWSDVFRDPEQKTADRLKASELLVKSSGLFIAPYIPGTADDSGETGSAGDVIIYIPKMLDEADRRNYEEETTE